VALDETSGSITALRLRGQTNRIGADISVTDARVATVISIMRKLLADQLSVATLSKRVRLSPTRLRQLFKEDTDRSPMRYLRDLRMQHAEHLLSSTFLSVKEIAFASGVKDVSNFVRDFKRRYGLTPKQFRSRGERSLKNAVKTVRDVD
jgi:AraC family transcriptional regulator, arabinose operon regulatory protein